MMSDPMTVITSAKAVVAAIKQGAALAKKAGNQEVYAILLDAQEQTLDLRERCCLSERNAKTSWNKSRPSKKVST